MYPGPNTFSDRRPRPGTQRPANGTRVGSPPPVPFSCRLRRFRPGFPRGPLAAQPASPASPVYQAGPATTARCRTLVAPDDVITAVNWTKPRNFPIMAINTWEPAPTSHRPAGVIAAKACAGSSRPVRQLRTAAATTRSRSSWRSNAWSRHHSAWARTSWTNLAATHT